MSDLDNINLKEKSSAFKAFIESFVVHDRESSEDLNIRALMGLSGNEKKEAEKILIDYIEHAYDPRVPRAIGYIKFKGALNTLRRNLNCTTGPMKTEIANAIFEISGDESMTDVLIDDLYNGLEFTKCRAAISLSKHKGKKVEDALLKAFEDEEYTVRNNAHYSYFKITGLNDWHKAWNKRGIDLLEFRLLSNFKVVRDEAKKDMLEIVRQKRNGKTTKELGLPTNEIPDSKYLEEFMQSYLPKNEEQWPEHYDMASYDNMGADEQKWSEYVCYTNIKDKDFRAVGALLHIHAKFAADVFKESLPDAEGRFLVELVYGLWLLTKEDYKDKLRPIIKSKKDITLAKRAIKVYNLIDKK